MVLHRCAISGAVFCSIEYCMSSQSFVLNCNALMFPKLVPCVPVAAIKCMAAGVPIVHCFLVTFHFMQNGLLSKLVPVCPMI